MKNYIQDGEFLTATAPAAVAAGAVYEGTNLIGVWADAVASGAQGTIAIEGVFLLTNATGVAFTLGQALYWDAGNDRLTSVATNNIPAGVAAAAAASGDTTARIKLEPGGPAALIV